MKSLHVLIFSYFLNQAILSLSVLTAYLFHKMRKVREVRQRKHKSINAFIFPNIYGGKDNGKGIKQTEKCIKPTFTYKEHDE